MPVEPVNVNSDLSIDKLTTLKVIDFPHTECLCDSAKMVLKVIGKFRIKNMEVQN